ncbi:MAG: TonB-dependent receptor plug domain-containing protein [Flavobacteriales bacterium]|nr:TonB-dependent receptor plug domain-containing protein [Flavobacteriales bacterium]
MDYLLKSAGIITLFFLVYKIFLEKDTFFKSIRLFLISGIVLSFIMPLVSITTYKEIITKDLSNFVVVNSSTTTPIEVVFDWQNLIFILFAIGLCITVGNLLVNLLSLIKLLSQSDVKRYNNFKIITTTKQISPFSFFNYIVYNPSQFNETELKQLLKHEQTHALELHTVDMLLAQILVCVQWFNPLAWLYKKAVNQNLEYIADQSAKYTVTLKNYSYLLLKTTTPNYQMALANNFYNSLLKKRIMMLHKNHSHRLSQLKLALILPLLIAFIFVFNTKVVAQHKDNNHKIDVTVFAMTLDKDFTSEDVAYIKSTFKNDFDFQIKIKNVKRNAKNEVTGIKIIASKGNSNTQYAVKGDTPIAPIRFMYNSKDNQVNISAVTEKHFGKKHSYTYEFKNDKTPKIHKLKKVRKNDKSPKNYKLKKISKDGNDQNVEIFVVSENDSLHQIKSTKKGNYIIISSDDKDYETTIKNANYIAKWKDKDGKLTKVIEVKTDKNGNISKTIDIKTDGKGENIFINEVDIDASEYKNSKMGYYHTNNHTQPLFIIDGKEITNDKFKDIDPDTIKSINVLKGENAIKKYGEKAKNGVIEITLKSKE